MKNLENRIQMIERALSPEIWPSVKILIYDDEPQPELFMITRSGTPVRPGRSFVRMENESEPDFLARAEAGVDHG